MIALDLIAKLIAENDRNGVRNRWRVMAEGEITGK
jgi:hypothetical protein